MLKLIDLIKLTGIELHDFKIHCATPNKKKPDLITPLNAFFDGTFKQWQENQNQKNFECDHILSLINLEKDRWLFAGVYVVDKRAKPRHMGGFRYSTHEVSGLNNLVGKAIVQFKRPGRNAYLLGPKRKDCLFVVELLSQRMTIGDFPGYKSVRLSYGELKTIIRESNPSWSTALSNVAGIYLITDTSDGKLYVGKADGREGIWQRWTAYISKGAWSEEITKRLAEKSGIQARYFQFSLLEVFDLDTDKDYASKKETHWKDVLKTREFGLNKN